MRTRSSVAVVGLAVLMLAGCGGSADEPEAPPTTAPAEDGEPAESPEPSVEPTPTEEPVDLHPALADLIITTSGLGPLTVGAIPPADNPGAAMVAWDADLQATYPRLSGPFAGPGSQVWWLSDAAGHLVFETQGADMIAPGAPEQVILIRVLAPDWPPEFAAANSGNVAGACF